MSFRRGFNRVYRITGIFGDYNILNELAVLISVSGVGTILNDVCLPLSFNTGCFKFDLW